jgi:hypothetical protein
VNKNVTVPDGGWGTTRRYDRLGFGAWATAARSAP